METKHTKEYAEKLAKEDAEYLPDYADKEFSIEKFTEGYMKAIEETAAPELLEALININNILNSAYQSSKVEEILDITNNAIKKATK